jgi:D-xylose transport system substrate-binding protein
MTVYKAIRPQAEAAAQLAVDLARDRVPAAGAVADVVDNGAREVPSILLQPVVVTRANIKDTVIADGFLAPAQLCAGGRRRLRGGRDPALIPSAAARPGSGW